MLAHNVGVHPSSPWVTTSASHAHKFAKTNHSPRSHSTSKLDQLLTSKYYNYLVFKHRMFRSTSTFDAVAMTSYDFSPDVKQECLESHSPGGDWPPISVKAACDMLLQGLDDLTPISQSALGQNLGYASVDQKIVYWERRSYLQSVSEHHTLPNRATWPAFERKWQDH